MSGIRFCIFRESDAEPQGEAVECGVSAPLSHSHHLTMRPFVHSALALRKGGHPSIPPEYVMRQRRGVCIHLPPPALRRWLMRLITKHEGASRGPPPSM